MLRNNIICIFIFLAFCATQLAAEGGGTITGLVLDEHGNPLVDASVQIELLGKGAPFISVSTDAQGRFVKQNLSWGSYEVSGSKESAGYPSDTWFIFNDKTKSAKAVVSEAARSADVTVRLGPPVARLSSVRVSDAVTRRPVTVTDPRSGRSLQSAGVTLIREDMKTPTGLEASVSTGTLKNILVPDDVPVIIRVDAEGYADWYYPGVTDRSKAQPIRLKSGESLSLDVLLQPLPSQ